MPGPKFSYLTGLTVQIFALIFIITKHNVFGGMLLFLTGDLEMLLAIRFSRLKEDKYFTLFDLSISTVYYAIYILIYFFIVYSLPLSFLPQEIDVMILGINAYGCFRILFPLLNIKKGKFSILFFNLMLVCWLIPLTFLTDDAYFAIVSKAFFIQVLYLLGGTMIFCAVSAIKQPKSKGLFQGCGCLVLFIGLIGGYYIFLVSIVILSFISVAIYFYSLILIWLLIVNYFAFQYEEIKSREDLLAPLVFVGLFYIILLLLLSSIIPLLFIISVTEPPI